MLLSKIILHSLQGINEERTINSIYYLLTGKQSIQTIQDAHLFQLERYFSLYKALSVDEFQTRLLPLQEKQYIEPCGNNTYKITPKGKQVIERSHLQTYYWNGLTYGPFDEKFLHRLILIIQVWTNRLVKNNRYIPIVDDFETTRWVKSFYYRQGNQVEDHLRRLYDELVALFTELDESYPRLFMKQLTTSDTIGLTNEQLADYFQKSPSDIHLLQKSYLHYMLQSIEEEKSNYPLLFLFAEDFFHVKQTNIMTNSAQITDRLVKRGLTPEQIARKRNLRITTIYDHIVEIALHDESFPMENFISMEKQREVYEAVKSSNSFKLKDIKSYVDEEVTYFQIRLALTKLKQMKHDGVMK